MMTEDARCAEAKKAQRIDDAFRLGDLDALRAAVDDPAAVPNGPMPGPMSDQVTITTLKRVAAARPQRAAIAAFLERVLGTPPCAGCEP
jgi:hypothetical protein